MKWAVDNYKIVSIDQVNSYMNFDLFLCCQEKYFQSVSIGKKGKPRSKLSRLEIEAKSASILSKNSINHQNVFLLQFFHRSIFRINFLNQNSFPPPICLSVIPNLIDAAPRFQGIRPSK